MKHKPDVIHIEPLRLLGERRHSISHAKPSGLSPLSLSSASYVSNQASPSTGEKRIPRSLRYAHNGLNNANDTNAKSALMKRGGCATKGVRAYIKETKNNDVDRIIAAFTKRGNELPCPKCGQELHLDNSCDGDTWE